jgi:3-deoxy-D-manno-octulosonate cytidylyltransferase
MGKPMVQWVVEASRAAGVGERVLVATPDREIMDACERFGADAILTSADHPSGTDRIAEVARSVEAEVYVNVQGDEPLIRPESIRACADPLLRDAAIPMGSIWSECLAEEIDNPAVVKVVTDLRGNALYFSRYALPFPRSGREDPVKKHVGIYAYRREAVMAFASWEQTPLEKAESLEQLRFLENGIRIMMSRGEGSAMAVDTPEQADEVRRILASLGN